MEAALRGFPDKVYIGEAAYTLQGSWQDFFPGGERTVVELGAGKGQFLCSMAQAHPNYRLIGLEREPGVLLQAVRKAAKLELQNLKFVLGDAEQLSAIFAPAEIDALFIQFCDPWPKTRHARRRLTHPGFLALYRKLLSSEGKICFKTDNTDLFTYSLAMFAEAGMEILHMSYDLHRGSREPAGCITEYEAKFSAAGLPVQYCEARFRTEHGGKRFDDAGK